MAGAYPLRFCLLPHYKAQGVAPGNELDAEVAATAARIADGAPLGARWHKRLTRRLMDPAPLTPQDEDVSCHCFGTADFREGYRPFLAKRKPWSVASEP